MRAHRRVRVGRDARPTSGIIRVVGMGASEWPKILHRFRRSRTRWGAQPEHATGAYPSPKPSPYEPTSCTDPTAHPPRRHDGQSRTEPLRPTPRQPRRTPRRTHKMRSVSEGEERGWYYRPLPGVRCAPSPMFPPLRDYFHAARGRWRAPKASWRQTKETRPHLKNRPGTLRTRFGVPGSFGDSCGWSRVG